MAKKSGTCGSRKSASGHCSRCCRARRRRLWIARTPGPASRMVDARATWAGPAPTARSRSRARARWTASQYGSCVGGNFVCSAGYMGEACDRPRCPNDGTELSAESCGAGQCKSKESYIAMRASRRRERRSDASGMRRGGALRRRRLSERLSEWLREETEKSEVQRRCRTTASIGASASSSISVLASKRMRRRCSSGRRRRWRRCSRACETRAASSWHACSDLRLTWQSAAST